LQLVLKEAIFFSAGTALTLACRLAPSLGSAHGLPPDHPANFFDLLNVFPFLQL
jgi:hypothetical protein